MNRINSKSPTSASTEPKTSSRETSSLRGVQRPMMQYRIPLNNTSLSCPWRGRRSRKGESQMKRSSSRFRYLRIIDTRSRGWSSHRLLRHWKISICSKKPSNYGFAWFKVIRRWHKLQTDIGSFKSNSQNRSRHI